MDSLDLLAREDEFKKLNKQLEKKTEILMKEIEHVMQKQDIFSEFSSSLTLSPVHTIKKHNCDSHRSNTPPSLPQTHKPAQKKKKPPQSSPNSNAQLSGKVENGTQNSYVGSNDELELPPKSLNTCNCCANVKVGRIGGDEEFLYAFVSVNVKDKVLPQSFLKDRPTVENVCKFLSSKVKLMQEQIDKQQQTINKKTSQCDGHLKQLAELEGQRLSLISKTNSMVASTADMKAKNMVLMAKLNEKDRLYIEQRTETDRLACELNRCRTKCNSVEARSAAQQETIDNLKQQLEVAKRSEKEFRDSARNLSAYHEDAISRLDEHIKQLNTRNDRQMALIDNLRKQNALMTAECFTQTLEREFNRHLEE